MSYNKNNILIISNETKIINKLSVVLDNSTYEFELSKDPLESLYKIRKNNYNLIIINNTFSNNTTNQIIKKIRMYDPFTYIMILCDDNNISETKNLVKIYDIEAYHNKNSDFSNLIITVELLINSIFEFTRVNMNIDNYNKEYVSPYLTTVQILRNIVEYKDSYTIGHSFRVSKYSILIGKRIGLSPQKLKTLKIGSMFHDIGKISIPNQILLKDSKLTDVEYMQIKQHPLVGAHILSPAKMYSKTIPIVKFHHEKYDGTGYPCGLIGDEIPLLVRIVTIADTFDAMTSRRTYRDALSIEKVLSEFENNKGTQFDPELTDIFLDILKNNYEEIEKIQNKYK